MQKWCSYTSALVFPADFSNPGARLGLKGDLSLFLFSFFFHEHPALFINPLLTRSARYNWEQEYYLPKFVEIGIFFVIFILVIVRSYGKYKKCRVKAGKGIGSLEQRKWKQANGNTAEKISAWIKANWHGVSPLVLVSADQPWEFLSIVRVGEHVRAWKRSFCIM